MKIAALLRRLGSAEAIFYADAAALQQEEILNAAEREVLLDKSIAPAKEIINQCYELGISILTWQDVQYPERLRNIPDPPVVLYYKGKLPDFDNTANIAIVGARKSTAFGLLTAKRFGYQLGAAGAIVISGLADGIDAMGMTGALLAGAPVVGVLGCGADVIYPMKNRDLYQDTMVRGCILTEYPPHTPPMSYNFPLRNRIISGLSDGVVIVEAPLRSGSLITARLALEQGRDVFAVPGNAGLDACAGSNHLLRQGAGFAESAADVLESYFYRFPQLRQISNAALPLTELDLKRVSEPAEEAMVASPIRKPKADTVHAEKPAQRHELPIPEDLPEDQRAVFDLLRQDPHSVDDMIDLLPFTPAQVISSLTILEVNGYIKKVSANQYAIVDF